jgi:teichuronic acid biosynthesis glycosyltransferase TuaC
MLRILTFSSLFPSSARPTHGIFVETRLRELVGSGLVESRVIAPVAWFPSKAERFGEYSKLARTPRRELRNGLDVSHPRYFLPPKIGMNVAPLLMALGARSAVQGLLDEGFDFDVIDAHYFYPDGVAAALLARHFKKPFTITARGTDLTFIPQYALPRRMMHWAAKCSAASMGVCGALVDVLRHWGLPPDQLHVLRNGVDLNRFRPVFQGDARAEVGLKGSPLLLSVGRLVELKGHHIAIEALAELMPRHPDARLVIVGEGEERQRLLALAKALGVQDRVHLVGAQANAELLRWYSAADVLVLASSREGWANVLLEAMACGTPVVATRIWGTPEVVGSEQVGRLVDQRTGEGFGRAISELLADKLDRAEVRKYAEQFSWQATTDAQLALFSGIAARSFGESGAAKEQAKTGHA